MERGIKGNEKKGHRGSRRSRGGEVEEVRVRKHREVRVVRNG